jgi:hypothetical protein
MVLPQPDLPVGRGRREFPPSGGRVRRINLLEQLEAIGPDLVCLRLSLLLPIRQVVRIEARASVLGSGGIQVWPQPI